MVLALAVGVSQPAAAQQTRVTSQEIRAASAVFLAEGDNARAAELADLILAVNPDDLDALITRARAALGLGDYETAKRLSKQAYRGTSNRDIKYVTARLAALAHAEQRQDTFAQLWLRRARQFAPNEENAEQVARDYRFLANRNPWSSSLRFGLSPSSNVNNGTEADFIFLRGLPFAFTPDENSRPLSGIEVSLGASTQYRLNVTETSATFLDFDVQGRTYVLSNESKRKVPDAKGSDYSDAALGIGITHRRILAEGLRPTTFSARLSQTWYSGDPYTRNIDLSASHSWLIGEQYLLGVNAAVQNRESLDDDPDVRVYRLGTTWTQIFENKDRFTAGLTYGQSQSDGLDQDYESLRLTANYSFDEPFANMKFGFGLEAERREFDATDFGNDTRSDRKGTVRMRVQFTDFEIYGFQPVATFEATRNESDVALFDREYVNFGFDLQSSF